MSQEHNVTSFAQFNNNVYKIPTLRSQMQHLAAEMQLQLALIRQPLQFWKTCGNGKPLIIRVKFLIYGPRSANCCDFT